MFAWLERHQVALYLGSLAAGAGAGFLVSRTPLPRLGAAFEVAVTPALGALLLATFLAVPLKIPRGEYAFPPRFLGWLLVLNFLLNPLMVAALLAGIFEITRISSGLLFAAALVLLAPCIDYVVVFCGLAGGSHQHLLRVTPLLLLAQLLALPLWLTVYAFWGIVEPPAPLSLRALATSAPAVLVALATVLVPLALAYLLQRGTEAIRARAENLSERAMVPLMMLVLFTTVAAHFGAVAHQLSQFFPLMITYAVYALVSGLLAWFLAAKTQVADRVALTFSAVTRNALVVLPFVLGLAEIAGQPALPLAVVSQTLVELLVMVGMVKLLRPVTARQNKSGQQAQNREEPSGAT
ncbi:arsenic resistance protein [Rothia aerolata]|uniref:Arsenic resistance protein n=1 Tax=Rothia aerolata TaxID=1812262 RepID=A0A917IX07_9MICC|nr:arsenic resistance protein [Rothia aerolata]GGH67149.1 arsenic resistance protein [Rothia aerolata]